MNKKKVIQHAKEYMDMLIRFIDKDEDLRYANQHPIVLYLHRAKISCIAP